MEKTEAIMFKRKYKDRPPVISIEGTPIVLKRSIRYLGIEVDDLLSYKGHVASAAAKAQRVLSFLSRIMPNIGGPSEPRRKLFSVVVHSVLLYGAPVWASSLPYAKKSVEAMASVQRKVALRNICAYISVSHTDANILAAMPPIKEQLSSYQRKRVEVLPVELPLTPRQKTFRAWAVRVCEAEKGLWTKKLVGDVKKWCCRTHGQTNFHLTQLLTGYGCFGQYLYKIGKEPSPACHHCGNSNDDAAHTLLACPAWEVERATLEETIGGTDDRSLGQKILASQANWEAVAHFASVVMRQKEDAERARERRQR